MVSLRFAQLCRPPPGELAGGLAFPGSASSTPVSYTRFRPAARDGAHQRSGFLCLRAMLRTARSAGPGLWYPRRRFRMRIRSPAAIWVLGLASLLFAARAGVAYRFFAGWNGDGSASVWASRWDESALPAKFRLLENDLAGRGLSDRFLRSIIEEAFAQWNRIPTSTFRAELAQQPVAADRPGWSGVSEIGFATDIPEYAAGNASVFDGPAGVSECDIRLHPSNLPSSEDGIRSWLLRVVTHELGHCLGLSHSEQYPVSDWFPEAPSAFSPPPVMAYAWTFGSQLAEDDRVGASLLYPTPAFTRSRGAVGGRVMREEGPASFVYIQAFRAGTPPEAGPGSFTEYDGQFVLEGLRPGPTLLWMHPVLVTGGEDPHGLGGRVSASEGRTAVQDQWRWVTVTAGETTIVPDIVAATGRLAASP